MNSEESRVRELQANELGRLNSIPSTPLQGGTPRIERQVRSPREAGDGQQSTGQEVRVQSIRFEDSDEESETRGANHEMRQVTSL